MDILSFILKHKEIIFAVITVFLVASASIFYVIRAGDFKALSDRVWRILAGSAVDSKGVVNEFIDETRNIERIRFVYGVRVNSNCDILKLKRWIDSNNLTMRGLQGCLGYLKIADRVSVVRPSDVSAFGFLGLSLFSILLLPIFFYISILNEVYIETSETKIYVLASKYRIRSSYFSGGNWSFGVKDCAEDRVLLKNITGLGELDLDSLCDSLGKDVWERDLSPDLRLQKNFGFLGFLLFHFLFTIFFIKFASCWKARKLHDKLKGSDSMGLPSSMLRSSFLCRVRAITAFATLSSDAQTWPSVLAEAKRQCDQLAAAFQQGGYTVQSVRIVANPFGEYLDTSSLEAASRGLATIRDILMQLNQNGLRIRFAIGEARTAQEIALLPGLIRDHGDLSNACVNVEANADGLLDNAQILRCVEAMREIARITPRGEGNFNFTVNFNCAPLIPYFPAGYHRSERGDCLVVGLETPDLLAAALRTLPQAEHAERMAQALGVMREALQYHVDAVQRIVRATPLDAGWTYAGMDTSAAPSKNCTSMVEVYRLLGVPYFGAAGTVEASALLTRLFKSVKDVEAVGFSGLMLAVTEDEGLAAATRAGQFDIRALLTYSAVCGIGLDTVPIAGDTPVEKIAAIMRDTGTMAFRLNKPLTVRLFPVPGLAAGDLTRFESDDLCNCAVLAVP